MLHASTIGGYVLEEILAKLLADNGYDLLTSDTQDPEHLLRDKHGLLVRGRGANHQADALGDLLVPVPFSLPVRLFAEAKNRASKTGLDAVRNAMGVVSDVNQFQPQPTNSALRRRNSTHHYRYSLFSTSGFTFPAQEFAIAHHISLIDLSGPAFASLRRAVEVFASSVQALAVRHGLDTFPIGQMRAALRAVLGTVQEAAAEADPSTGELPLMPWNEILALAYALAEEIDDDLLLGFPAGPQVLALRPDNAQAFRQWASETTGIVPMRLRYAPGLPDGEWIVVPTAYPIDRKVVLRFGTPPALAEWLFALGSETRQRLDDMKSDLLSTITIYQSGHPIVLQLDVEARQPRTSVSRELMLSRLRDERADPALAWELEGDPADRSGAWSTVASARYVEILQQRDPERLRVLLYAAVNGYWISRAHVYELMNYEPHRKMTGFTKPYETARKQLVVEGLLSPQVLNPVTTNYTGPGSLAIGLDLDRGLGITLLTQLPSLLEIGDYEDR